MKQVIVSGFGGQGVLSLGLMLAYAAMHENVNTSFLPSYGPEMRGGTANCHVVLSEKEVASPIISTPDLLVAFNEPSLVRFLPQLNKGGTVFADSETTDKKYLANPAVVGVPLAELCGGNRKGQNIVMLGAVLPRTGLSLASAEGAVKKVFRRKPQFIESNLACLHAGYEWARNNA